MPGSLIAGSWNSTGYYGHDRSRTYSDCAQTYRRLATPAPPQVFLKRSQLPVSKHAFSEHDSRQSLSCGPIYFEHNIGKRRSSCLQPRDRRQRNFLTWIPDRKDTMDTSDLQNTSLSSYTIDYRGVQLDLPKMNQRLVEHLRDGIEEDKKTPISTYRKVHCSLYPELLDVSKISTTSKDNGQATTSSNPTVNHCHQPRSASNRDSVARCLIWYQPSNTRQAATQTIPGAGDQIVDKKSQVLVKEPQTGTLDETKGGSDSSQDKIASTNHLSSLEQDVPAVIAL